MTATFKHVFVSAIPDDPVAAAAGEVLTQSHWNAAHAITNQGALSAVNDTNVTLSLTGTPTTALLEAVTVTAGWAGTLAAGRLNSNVVQSVVNDTNVTGSISAQALTLGWTGTLAAARLNANVVQSVVNDTNVTGSIAAQALTLGWTGTLANSRLATMAANTIKGNNTASTASPSDLTVDQTDIMLGARITANAQTGTTYTFQNSDNKTLVSQNNAAAIAVTLPQAGGGGNFASGWWAVMTDLGAGTATITPTTSTINGAATLAVPTGDGYMVASDGSNYQALQVGNFNKQGTDIELSGRLTLFGTTQGNAINAFGNGTVLTSNYFAYGQVVYNVPVTHTGAAYSAFGIVNYSKGTAADRGSPDLGLVVTSEQLNYLTSSVAGEPDAISAFSYGGANCIHDVYQGTLVHRANGSSVSTNSSANYEFDTRLVNGTYTGSGATGFIAQMHGYTGYLFAADTAYGFGIAAEAQIGTWHAGLLVDTFDNHTGSAGTAPDYTYAILARKARSDNNKYFSVSTGGIVVGNANTAQPYAIDAGSIFRAIGADSRDSGFAIATTAGIPYIHFLRSEGTLASQTAVALGQSIGQFTFGGFDGTNNNQAGVLFNATTTETWTSTKHGAFMSFYTTPTGTTATAEAGRFSASGGFSVGSIGDPGAGGLLVGANLFHPTVANSTVATAMSSVGPAGSHTTIQEWFPIKNASGTTRYVPGF